MNAERPSDTSRCSLDRRFDLRWILAGILTVVPSVPAPAASAWRCLDPEPIAVRGGVVLLPIAADSAAEPEWPTTIPVTLRTSDAAVLGRVEGVVGWLVPTPSRTGVRWTDSAEPLTVLADRPDGGGVPLLLVPTPGGFAGTLELEGMRIAPRWLEPATTIGRPREGMPALSPEARPDSQHPLEWYRWAILADRIGFDPPPPPGDPAAQLAAWHLAEVWRAAIARVAAQSPGVAAEVRERLTATCTDLDSGAPREVAAWIADPSALRSLLGVMLDPGRSDEAVMQGTLAWLRAEPELVTWIDESLGDRVIVGIANPGFSSRLVRARWLEGDPIPVALPIPPRSVRRFELDRPVELAAATDGGVLVLDSETASSRLDFGPAPIAVRPPGLWLGPLHLPLSLGSATTGVEPLPPANRRATAEIRRRGGGWELFVECFRPADVRDDRLEIRFGPEAAPTSVCTVSEQGGGSGALEIGQASYPDRWRCRVRLPDSWLADALVGVRAPGTGISLRRTLELEDGSKEISAIGFPRPPWRTQPPVVVLDLSAWPERPVTAAVPASE